jgi:TetR/AcrR family transcriptional regulator, regulator of autoinduction and epiphytic fitness
MLHEPDEMVAETDQAAELDGRTARRDRNRIAAIDAVLELFSEGELTPTPEQVADRSGVSLRSVYRYFANRGDLIRAAVDRHLERVQPLFVIDAIGEGALDERVESFVAARIRGYEAIAATARASRLRAPSNDVIREQLDRARHLYRAQLEHHFARELAALDPPRRRAVLAAADALTQIETIELYRVQRGYSTAETHELLATALRILFEVNR